MLKFSKFLLGSFRLFIPTPETPDPWIAAWVTVKPPIPLTPPTPPTPGTPTPAIPIFYGALMTSLLFADGGRLPLI